MSLAIMNISSALIQRHAVAEILSCNEFTAKFGLILSRLDAIELVETRTKTLKSTGRVEFGGGVIEKLIREFCTSSYISRHNYVETLHGLIEIFYYYKNETLDLISDDELIKFMRKSFDEICQGSLELLSGRELYNLARNLRYGFGPDCTEDYLEGDEEDGES